MAHDEQRDFFIRLGKQFPQAFRACRVLEIGSLNVNGTVRDFFRDCDYTGVDIVAGPGVDVVGRGEKLDYADGSFDVVVSAECFEHNAEWAATFRNIWRMSRKYVFLTCASTGRPEHGTHDSRPEDSPGTTNYYRNLSEQDFRAYFFIEEMFESFMFEYNPSSCDLYFWGVVR